MTLLFGGVSFSKHLYCVQVKLSLGWWFVWFFFPLGYIAGFILIDLRMHQNCLYNCLYNSYTRSFKWPRISGFETGRSATLQYKVFTVWNRMAAQFFSRSSTGLCQLLHCAWDSSMENSRFLTVELGRAIPAYKWWSSNTGQLSLALQLNRKMCPYCAAEVEEVQQAKHWSSLA